MKTLYLEKRGCDFWDNDNEAKLSDVGNYRVGIYDNSIRGKDGRDYSLEFGGYDKRNYRTTNKRTGAKLKKPVMEIIQKNALYVRTYYDEGFMCYGNVKLEGELSKKNYSYTMDGILQAVNDISADTYTSIEFV